MKIERSALVTYSAMDMYTLVQDVSSYPQFLSWCTATTIHEQSSEMQKASLSITVAGINQHFTTHNSLLAGERLEMKLLKGPFSKLQGNWHFTPLGDDGSKVSLKLEFEMRNGLVSSVFGKGFGRIADRLVDDFCKRADAVYRP
jgi:ribosome-associated toxin RatA of RatAB toxin-antitoxin module